MCQKVSCICLFILLFLTSCVSRKQLQTTASRGSGDNSIKIWRTIKRLPVGHKGVRRLTVYDIAHPDIPSSFEGCKLAFISDLHYRSLLKKRGLKNLMRLLYELKPDVLLLGGDFYESCSDMKPLVDSLSHLRPLLGTYAVLGNNDYERCYEEVLSALKDAGIDVLEHKVDTLYHGEKKILLAGVRNPFDLRKNGVSPSCGLSDEDFVILLTHTPDYAEDVPITHVDLVLAGHTHGGQVKIFGFAPVVPSRYGRRFLSGLCYNSDRIPVIVTNGIGTSRINFRLGAPSEVVLIKLHSLYISDE